MQAFFQKINQKKNIGYKNSQPSFRNLLQESINEIELKETGSKEKIKENSSEIFKIILIVKYIRAI